MDDQPLHPGPHLPDEAVDWLCGKGARTVALHGVRISRIARDAFTAAQHDVHLSDGELDVADRSVDLLILDTLPEDLFQAARALRPGGQLALVRTERDRRIPWARKLDRVLGTEPTNDPAQPIVTSDHFGFVGEQVFRHWQHVNHLSLRAVVQSEFADDPDVSRRVAAALELYADYGRGADGMQLPWVTTCHRATVVDSFWTSPRALDEAGEPTMPIALAGLLDESKPDPDTQPPTSGASYDLGADGPSTASDDLLLIDFR